MKKRSNLKKKEKETPFKQRKRYVKEVFVIVEGSTNKSDKND